MGCFVIGLTGQTGAGKSTVSRVLADCGIPVVDCDRLAREAVKPGSECLLQLVRAFGRKILRPDGSLDRAGMAAMAFPDPEKLAVLKDHGVTRVSVNPQTMEDHVLRAIGRRHTAADIEAAMELVAGYGFPHVNMDLIAGLPADTPEGFRRSLDRCLAFGTDNVTVHTLALKKGSRILLEGLPIPGPEAVAEMLDYAAPALRKAGYSPYYLYRQKYMSGSFENTGWCRPGAECWYNVQIMSELCSILSFGAGGSTKMVEPGTNHIERVFNLKYPKEYTERPEKAAANQAAFAAFYESLKGAQ